MRTTTALALAACLGLALSACGGDDGATGPTMRPGEDCLNCHSGFTAAGTFFTSTSSSAGVSGVVLTLTDGSHTVQVTTNSVGNFYTSQAINFPNTATVSGGPVHAHSSGQSGHCNSCHGAGNRLTP